MPTYEDMEAALRRREAEIALADAGLRPEANRMFGVDEAGQAYAITQTGLEMLAAFKQMPWNGRIRIYLATLFSRREEMEKVADKLTIAGYEVVSRWVYGGEDGLSDRDIAELDLEDVRKADIVMSYTALRGAATPGGGRHVEFGYGYALGKRSVIIGERENVFHHLPDVEVYATLSAFLDENYPTPLDMENF